MRFDPAVAVLTFPDLILFDEMDASLHPDMVRRWIEAVQAKLVKKKGIPCIITTHSPTTVALCPEESIYEMAFGRTKPLKISKQQAINRLTVGIPTLAINFSGRRYVFTENDVDADLYQRLLTTLEPHLSLPRTLAFTSSGFSKRVIIQVEDEVTKKVRNYNNGAGAVEKIVTALEDVYGIVDWDNQRKRNGRIFVSAENTHYTLENILLDPLLIGCLAIIERKYPERLTITQVASCDTAQLQAIVNTVCYDLLGYPHSEPKADSRYHGGKVLKVPAIMQSMDGKDLQAFMAGKLHWLKQYEQKNSLKQKIVDGPIAEIPDLCPAPITDLFRAIATDGDERLELVVS